MQKAQQINAHNTKIVKFYLSVDTPLGFYRGADDEATQKELDALNDAILNQELGILKLTDSQGQLMFFGTGVIANSIISINFITDILPF